MVSAAWLHGRLGEVAVVDVRESAARLRGAARARRAAPAVASLRSKTGKTDLFLLPAERLVEKFGAVGLAITTPVVIVADHKMHDATLAALAFLRCGHRALATLEGGLLRWATERRRSSPEPRRRCTRRNTCRDPAPTTSRSASTLGPRVQKGGTTMLDAHPSDFFRGDKSTEARPGHILRRGEPDVHARPRTRRRPACGSCRAPRSKPTTPASASIAA